MDHSLKDVTVPAWPVPHLQQQEGGPVTADDKHRAVLDEAIRTYAEDAVDDGEVITDWVVLAATRRFDGGGSVIHLVSGDGLPTYVVRGMLSESMAVINRRQTQLDEGEDEGG